MKKTRYFVLACAIALAGAFSFAKDVTIPGFGTYSIPDDFAWIVEQNMDDIVRELQANNVTPAQITTAVNTVNNAWTNDVQSQLSTSAPITTLRDGLNSFTDELAKTLPNTQAQQNIYAEAWIGSIFPGFHFAGGVNAGAASLCIQPIKDTALAIGIDDCGDLPSDIVFPTIAADLRLGGFILPFDIGFNVISFDSSSLESVTGDLESLAFDFSTFGLDVRYSIFDLNLLVFKPVISVGAGFYRTSGSFKVSNDDAKAALDFTTMTYYLSAQASCKFIFVTPFVGMKLLFSQNDVNWSASANWANIISTSGGGDLGTAAAKALLPKNFSGGTTTDFSEGVHPLLTAGLGIDILVLKLSGGVSYDIKDNIVGGGFNVRLGW